MKSAKDPAQVSWQRIILIVLCVILALVLFVMLFATAYVHHLLGLVTGNENSMNETISPEDLATFSEAADPTFTGSSVGHEEVPQDTVPNTPVDNEDIINILLIGEDRRPGQSRQRSDSMILCSFNTKTNTLTMISFLRDTYISNIPGYWAEKLNAAYAFGGAKTLKQTLAQYFGVHVDACAAVQFDGFKGIIDMLGGVDIELTEKEANYMNKDCEKHQIPWRVTPGMNHLNGDQALAYSRIRKIDMDAKRAERQRKVLTALINAYKNQPLTEMLTLTTDILETGFLQTDMSSSEALNYVKTLFPMLATTTINSQQIPAAGTYKEMSVGKITATKVCDLEANRKILQQILGN
ncbi:MAG: LytR family transcriptional regulator [Ruminococcaceae bacterium]|nr:LytR family transcriptional regulator [Oscillospiraceae bacterium]